MGERLWEQCHGQDSKPLDFNHERKSVSAEINYGEWCFFVQKLNLQICLGIRFKTKDECYNFLQSLANEVFNRLTEVNMKARGLTLKLLVRAEGAPVVISPIKSHYPSILT